MITLFDEKQIIRAYTHEKIAEGRTEGRAMDVTLLLQAGIAQELIASSLNMTLEEVNALKR